MPAPFKVDLKGRLAEASSTWRRFKRNKGAIVGLAIFLGVVFCAIFADFIAPNDPYTHDPDNALSPPSWKYPLGTDEYGRCIFSRIIYGSRISLLVGVVSVGIAAVVGVVIGLIAGYCGGIVDSVIMRIMDILLAFPGILLALLIVSVLGRNLVNCMVAVGIWNIPVYARLVRGMVLSVKETEYVLAAKALGLNDLRILFKHILPNCMAPIIVLSTLLMPGAILAAAGLSFLGLGAQPPTPEWGRMLSEGREFLATAWWIATFPGIAIFVTVMGLNLLGDGLRDALDPRLKVGRV